MRTRRTPQQEMIEVMFCFSARTSYVCVQL
jgi:hypothetical protein